MRILLKSLWEITKIKTKKKASAHQTLAPLKTERKTKDVQVVLGEGRDEDWDKHLGLTMLILKTKQNLNSK